MSGLSTTSQAWSIALDDHISAIAIQPNGSRALIGSLAGDAVLVDLATGNNPGRVPPHPLGLLDAKWSADGTRLATGGQDGIVRICDDSGATLHEFQLDGWVEHLAWSSNGTLAATAGKTLAIVESGGKLERLGPASSTIAAVAWCNNGTRVGIASYGGLAWYDVDRLRSGAPTRRHEFKGAPLALVLSPNDKWACAGYQDSSIHLWPLWSGDDLAMSGYPAKIEHLAFRPDGGWLASACLAELTWWDFRGRGPKGTAPAVGSAHEARVTWLGWSPNGDLLASGDADGTTLVWPSPTSTRSPVEPLHTFRDDEPVAVAAWTNDGNGLIIGRHDGTVHSQPVG